MTDREKKLAIGVALVIALWGGNWAWQNYSSWWRSAISQKNSTATDLQAAQLELQKARTAVRQLEAWRETSLPGNSTVAQSQYRAWLVEQLQAARLEVGDVNPRRAGGRTNAYQTLSYQVEATGKLDSVVQFLDSFYRSDQLHKITTLRLAPQLGSDDLRVSLSVEALVVSGTKRETGLAEGTSDRLMLPGSEEYVERIVGRNPFVVYRPPPPAKPDRPPVVREERPKPPPRPQFNHAEHAKLTGVVSQDGEYEAWVTVQTLGERLELRQGDPVSVGQFEGVVVDIYQKEMIVETTDGLLLFRVGDKLSDGFQLTSAGS